MKRKINGAPYTCDQLRSLLAADIEVRQALLGAGVLEGIMRRDEERNVVDGWPSGGGQEIRGSDISRPTENTGLRLAEGLPMPDPVHRHVEAILTRILDGAQGAGAIKVARQALESYHGELGRVDSTDTCQACSRTVPGTAADRLRSGMCPACYVAFGRYKNRCMEEGIEADRAAFARNRGQEEAA